MAIIYGDENIFQAVLQPEANKINQSYIVNQFQQLRQNTANYLNTAGEKFIQNAQDLYNKINDSAVMSRVRNAIKNSITSRDDTKIYHIESLDDFQTVGLRYQRYLMVNPVIRDRYHRQTLDGYSDTYVDDYPTLSGNEHPDYRRVINGMVQVDQETGLASCKQFIGPEDEFERDLYFDEKIHVIQAWELMEAYLENNIDPTNQYGGRL